MHRSVPHVHQPDADVEQDVQSDAGYRYDDKGDPE
jgi:hypothetical protein